MSEKAKEWLLAIIVAALGFSAWSAVALIAVYFMDLYLVELLNTKTWVMFCIIGALWDIAGRVEKLVTKLAARLVMEKFGDSITLVDSTGA